MNKEELELVDTIIQKGNEIATRTAVLGFLVGFALASLIWLVVV